MDSIKGAIELRQRFERNPPRVDSPPAGALPADAPLMFHWVEAGRVPGAAAFPARGAEDEGARPFG
jgi:hypothetical protein